YLCLAKRSCQAVLFLVDCAGAEEPVTQPGQVSLMSLWPFFSFSARAACEPAHNDRVASSALRYPYLPQLDRSRPFHLLFSPPFSLHRTFLVLPRQVYLIFGRCRCEEVGRRSCRGCHQTFEGPSEARKNSAIVATRKGYSKCRLSRAVPATSVVTSVTTLRHALRPTGSATIASSQTTSRASALSRARPRRSSATTARDSATSKLIAPPSASVVPVRRAAATTANSLATTFVPALPRSTRVRFEAPRRFPEAGSSLVSAAAATLSGSALRRATSAEARITLLVTARRRP
ncbi:hypothetical protein B0T18DRAFT_56284, partial [Schizothecium vesticola]